MAASNDSVVTRPPWIDLSQHGFRVLHTKDGKNRHMVMLAPPLIPDEELQTTRNRLAEYAGSLKSMTGTPEHPVKGTLYKDKYWILTGSGLSTFKGIWSTVKKKAFRKLACSKQYRSTSLTCLDTFSIRLLKLL